MGPTFYQRLIHMAEDPKEHRAVHPLTRQPVADRKRFGGVRFREMERDCLLGSWCQAGWVIVVKSPPRSYYNMSSSASDDDEEPYQEGLVDVPVMLNDVDIHVQLQSEEYIHMFNKFRKTRQPAQQTTLGESSHAQGLASDSHVSTSQEGGLQTQAGASASHYAHVHSQASASQAEASVSQSVHSQAGASQSGGLHTPRSLPDAANISEHATINRQTLGSASSVASVGTTRRGRGPSRATSIRILPPGQTFPIDIEGGSSVGPYAQKFTTYLGVCNRVHCNLWQQGYMTLPSEKKEAILRDLQYYCTHILSRPVI
ncbi:hypothetical protein Taro_048381 [Colocasia esculenta]|uniref:DNA-directed RNA polymerase n=1 Tax=Colocasia esculenta TaxID=4460 RepID=A0A843X7E9_COLES|nr:hypothetical protein [Colocasia esculenta]